jgi:hypothetical protein
MLIKKSNLVAAFIVCSMLVQAQQIKPNFQDLNKWNIINRTAVAVNEDGKNAIRINEVPNDGQMVLKGIEFSNGTIEVDIKGKNVLQQSFVGIAFHGVDDKTYDAIYFRPFNFMNADTVRRWRAVQYISVPDYPWEKLREKFPGKYENKVNPVPDPDGWFHVKIVVDGKKITTYVNDAQTPSLVVEKLTSTTTGMIALWVGNNSGGAFANLVIIPR